MLAVISPAKKLDFNACMNAVKGTKPRFPEDTEKLVSTARKLSRSDLSNLMGISEQLADLNYQRFQSFESDPAPEKTKPAVYAFNGDTYVGLDAGTLDDTDIDYAQNHLAILSGLYGLLRPRDLIQPYRLEMGKRLRTDRGDDLYGFWGERISKAINELTQGHEDRALVNLASNEYFKAVKPKLLEGQVVTPVFKEIKGGQAKVIGLFAKRARGAMARFIIKNRLDKPEGMKDFTDMGYRFQPAQSNEKEWLFTREAE